jgi:hypothetical protein
MIDAALARRLVDSQFRGDLPITDVEVGGVDNGRGHVLAH